MRIETNGRELAAAGLAVLLGVVAVGGGLQYTVGDAARMGPGYFPVMVGAALILVGALMIATPLSDDDADPANRGWTPQYRAWACVILGMIAFIALGAWAGLLPATFVLVLIAALGDRGNSPKAALMLAVGVSVMAVVLFSWLLQLQFPLIRWG